MVYRSYSIPAILSLAAFAGMTVAAAAEDPLGFYVGAELGHATLQNQFENPYAGGGIGQTATRSGLGWDAFIGIRPVRWLGAEVQYMDFGRTHIGSSYIHTFNGRPVLPDFLDGANGHSYAAAAFAVAYLPLSRRLELFAKLGASRLRTSYSYAGYFPDVCLVNTTTGTCTTVGQVSGKVNSGETDLAYGGGLRFQIDAFALRLEYQRLNSRFGTPALVSAGFTWEP